MDGALFFLHQGSDNLRGDSLVLVSGDHSDRCQLAAAILVLVDLPYTNDGIAIHGDDEPRPMQVERVNVVTRTMAVMAFWSEASAGRRVII